MGDVGTVHHDLLVHPTTMRENRVVDVEEGETGLLIVTVLPQQAIVHHLENLGDVIAR